MTMNDDDQGVVLSADMPPEQVQAMFDQCVADGLLDYVLGTDPLGESWVLGSDGQILRLDQAQAVAWLIGHQSTLHWLMNQIQSRGMKVVPA